MGSADCSHPAAVPGQDGGRRRIRRGALRPLAELRAAQRRVLPLGAAEEGPALGARERELTLVTATCRCRRSVTAAVATCLLHLAFGSVVQQECVGQDACAARGLLLRSGTMYYRCECTQSARSTLSRMLQHTEPDVAPLSPEACSSGEFADPRAFAGAADPLHDAAAAQGVEEEDEDSRFLRLCFSQPELSQLSEVGPR